MNTYHIIRLSILALSVFNCISTFANQEVDMPITAFYGVPADGSEEDYRMMRECGFTVNQLYYPNIESMIHACRLAHKQGIKILGTCPEMFNTPAYAANKLKNEEGFFGYMLRDEPSAPEIKDLHATANTIRQIDNTHCVYINLHPFYADWILEHTKTDSYEAYVDVAAAAPCQQISFDYYPVTKDGIRDTWHYNLDLIRRKSVASGKPFWAFICSVPHGVYPMPTIASLRIQAYTDLAYGAQAIQYFTYWTPPREAEGLNYHDGPISADGKKTKTYDLVRQMNQELKTVARLFYGAKVVSVHHLGSIPEGTTRQTSMPVNLRSLKIVGRQGAVISQIEKEGHLYLAIVNKSHEKELTVRIRAKNGVPRHITKSLQEESMKSNYAITAGDILLFKLK